MMNFTKGIYGISVMGLPMPNKLSVSFDTGYRHLHFAQFLTCVLTIIVLSACSTTMKYGTPPNISSLNKFQQGVSTKTDVFLLLGEPRGNGNVRFTASNPYLFDILFYEYLQFDGRNVSTKFLLILMDKKDVYQGHLWFSSNDIMGMELK